MRVGFPTWYGRVPEGGPFSILARVTAINGSGDLVLSKEGYCITQADVSSITCKVYSLGTNKTAEGTEITPAPTVVVADSIFDTLQLVGWGADSYGYNFRHDVAADYVPNAHEWYVFEYDINLDTGGVILLQVQVETGRLRSR